ncbi:putative toxin-antitoxin system toxin component, PIN family [Spirosoma agri]|jgi:putative PIN family toxin of toxin-antitoxin system|uniref:Putative toxin-antitoxin system toxin component, PIN family n=1 Tax=Spirosoma agri TaxID=1987381 RepID=A0A6M0IND8_9BACT|nr:putative toxin-antitoxin system toxin component, PIN family [Spirosoma agri]NEU69836.1 putative toxin-antitoxin system toxin component, PIN family [Spirosoma agri]
MKVVVDTNQLLSSISTKSSSHWLYQAIFSGKFTLCVTTDILAEYDEIIEWGFGRRDVADTVLEALINSPNVELVNVSFYWWLITADPDDNKFSDCAIAGGVDYLVTEDKHFNVLATVEFPRINVIGLEEFYEILKSQSS